MARKNRENQLENLKKENKALKEKVKRLEAGQTKDLTLQTSNTTLIDTDGEYQGKSVARMLVLIF